VITCLCGCHETGDIASCDAQGVCCETPGVLRFPEEEQPPVAGGKHRPLTSPDFSDWYFSGAIGPPK